MNSVLICSLIHSFYSALVHTRLIFPICRNTRETLCCKVAANFWKIITSSKLCQMMLVVSIEKEPEQRKSPGVKQWAGSCIPLSKKNFTGLIMHMLARHLITVHVGCQGHFAKISECTNLLLIGFPCWLKCFFFVHYEEHILGWPMNKCHTTTDSVLLYEQSFLPDIFLL